MILGILKTTDQPSSEIRGILKSSSSFDNPIGILKTDAAQVPETTTKGILKHTDKQSLEQRLESSSDDLKREILDTRQNQQSSVTQTRTRTISEPGNQVAEEEIVVALETSIAMASSIRRTTDSSTEDSESGERYGRIKNEAVLRRKIARDAKKQQDR